MSIHQKSLITGVPPPSRAKVWSEEQADETLIPPHKQGIRVRSRVCTSKISIKNPPRRKGRKKCGRSCASCPCANVAKAFTPRRGKLCLPPEESCF